MRPNTFTSTSETLEALLAAGDPLRHRPSPERTVEVEAPGPRPPTSGRARGRSCGARRRRAPGRNSTAAPSTFLPSPNGVHTASAAVPAHHLDLLPIVRRLWRDRLPATAGSARRGRRARPRADRRPAVGDGPRILHRLPPVGQSGTARADSRPQQGGSRLNGQARRPDSARSAMPAEEPPRRSHRAGPTSLHIAHTRGSRGERQNTRSRPGPSPSRLQAGWLERESCSTRIRSGHSTRSARAATSC